MELPTIKEAQEFLRLVNVGRVAGEMEPLDYLDFDGAEPGDTHGCLSHVNLFGPAGFVVYSNFVKANMGVADERVVKALNMGPGRKIPAGIKAVTDPFDSCLRDDHDEDDVRFNEDALAALRERLVEAGVVA